MPDMLNSYVRLGTVAAGSVLRLELHDAGLFVRCLPCVSSRPAARACPLAPQFDERLAAGTICIDALSYAETSEFALANADGKENEQVTVALG